MVSDSAPPWADRLHPLHTWIKSSGTFIGSSRIASDKQDPSLHSLQASSDIPADTAFLRIPNSHLITSTLARNHTQVNLILQRAADDHLDEQMPDTTKDSAALILFLLAELNQKEASFWKPWFDSLPSKFVTPLTAPEDRVLDMLAGTPALPFVQTLRTEMREMYDDWFIPYAVTRFPDTFPASICTFDTFMYAHAILESRAFLIDDITILAPFADMANHACSDSPRHNSRVRGWVTADAVENLGLEVLTRDKHVNSGQELCISYGCLANWQLLVHFGFALPVNGDDGFVIQLEADDDDDGNLAIAKMIILYAVCHKPSLNFTLTLDNPLPDLLLKCARILLLEQDEIGDGVRGNYSSAVSPRNERAVIKWLRGIIQRLLEDCEIAEDDERFQRQDGEDQNDVRLRSYCRIYVELIICLLQKTLEKINSLEGEIR